MNSNVKFIFGVVVGTAAGILCTKRYFAKKEQKRADEEIASVKERFTVPRDNKEKKKDIQEEKPVEEEKKESATTVRQYDAMRKEAAKAMRSYRGTAAVDEVSNEPYLISPDDFEENEPEHEHQTLIYFADGIVTDDADHVLDYPEDILGYEFEDWFGEYEPDCIHVRNKGKGVDYEVLRDMRRFRDVLNDRPRPVNIK